MSMYWPLVVGFLLTCIVTSSILVRYRFFVRLQEQGASIFSPDMATWQRYLGSEDTPLMVSCTLGLALFCLVALYARASASLWIVAMDSGQLLLIRHLLRNIPPVYGFCRDGFTVLHWSSFPLAIDGMVSRFVPTAEIVAIREHACGIRVISKRGELVVVLPPEFRDTLGSLTNSQTI